MFFFTIILIFIQIYEFNTATCGRNPFSDRFLIVFLFDIFIEDSLFYKKKKIFLLSAVMELLGNDYKFIFKIQKN